MARPPAAVCEAHLPVALCFPHLFTNPFIGSWPRSLEGREFSCRRMMLRTTQGSSPAGGPAPHPTVMAIVLPKSKHPASPKEEESPLLQLAQRSSKPNEAPEPGRSC